MAIDASAQFLPADGLLCQELDGEMVLLNPTSATYFSLNQIGTSIWQMLADRAAIGDICRALADRHHLPHDQVMSDLTPFIEELLEAGLIRPGR
jgi:hypothetical protein